MTSTLTVDRLRRHLWWVLTVVRHPVAVRAARPSFLRRPSALQGRLFLAAGASVFRGVDCVGPVWVGSASYVGPYGYLRPQVTIGDRVAIASHVRLITDSHEIGDRRKRAGQGTVAPIVVGDGAWIGATVTVLPGVTIGEGAIVAAGSVVTADVAPHTVVAGVPARLVRSLPGE